MTRTQVQLPNELYKEACRLAREKEISLAEVVRLGLEHMLRIHPPRHRSKGGWRLPPPVDLQLKADPFADPKWRENVDESEGGASVPRIAESH